MYPINQTSIFRNILAATPFLFVLPGFHSSAHAAASSIILAWNPSVSDVTGYKVHYGTASGDYTKVVDVGNQTTAAISKLSSGSTYYFAVTAYNSIGLESLPSAEISYTPPTNQVSTAQADNLLDAGLTGTNIGTGTGGSRVLSNGYWELTGGGIGSLGISDALYFESKDKTGNFQVLARIHSLESYGAAPEVGLMVRESTDADARFAMIAATPGAYTYASRTIAGGSASKTPVALAAEFPDVWVLIQRTGDLVEFAISTDGSTFDLVGSTVIKSLAENINVGLFAASGTPGVGARAIVTDYTEFDIAPATHGTGLTGRYYAGKNFDTLLLTRVENINFDWGSGSPDPSVPGNDFSVRWSGKLVPQYSEEYTLYTLANNGVRVWIDDELLIDDWNTNRETEDSVTITLEAGQMYDIRVEFLEENGQANVSLSWSSPSQPKEIIPVDALYPEEQ